MDARLDGRVLVVTGGTQGVGRSVALESARSGADAIFIVGRSAEKADRVRGEVEALGAAADSLCADLADPSAVDRAIDRCLDRFGRIDGLVNAAGLTDRASALNGTLEDWERLYAVNARAPFFLMQRTIAHLRERQAPGAIVNVLSMNVHCGAADLAIYASSKAALALLTRNAAHAHRFDRIRINGINMGWADTPAEVEMMERTMGKGEGWLARTAAEQPFGRLLSADDVARLCVFLLSDVSIPMTGALIDQEQWVAAGPR